MPEALTGVSALYECLCLEWSQFVEVHSLPRLLRVLPNAELMTWQEVLEDTVFYPGPPVFRGATFIDRLGNLDRAQILAADPRSVTDFFCFMMQVHEAVHRHQIGEPLLNEVLQASIWCQYLTEAGRWGFQRTGSESLVREFEVVNEHRTLFHSVVRAGLDSAKVARLLIGRNGYFVLCLAANRFDSGLIRYAEYLRVVATALRSSDNRSLRTLELSLL